MNNTIQQLARKSELTHADIVYLLSLEEKEEINELGKAAYEIKKQTVDQVTYFRGLIEFSNYCHKNCFYCGIRKDNKAVNRYRMQQNEIIDAAVFAWKNHFGSVVLQSGELESAANTDFICETLQKIKQATNGELGITLSCGEQSPECYQRFFDCGAHRYLLRIETSDRKLYQQLHPNDSLHDFERRIMCLRSIKEIGFQLGTGIMLGLPGQSHASIANDLLFFRDMEVDMVGMGPYIEHSQTPLFSSAASLMTKTSRFHLTLKAVAVLRLIMNDINIAAATALQTLDLMGREKALRFGANIIMPNITPSSYRKDYLLYEDKPCIDEEAEQCKDCLSNRIAMMGDRIGYDMWGDSLHFKK